MSAEHQAKRPLHKAHFRLPEHPAADPAKPTSKFTCLEAPIRLLTPYGPQLKCAGSTSMRAENSTRQGELQWWRHLDHNQAPF